MTSLQFHPRIVSIVKNIYEQEPDIDDCQENYQYSSNSMSSKPSFIEFKYGALQRKLSRKPTTTTTTTQQLSIRQNSNTSSSRTTTHYQPNVEEMKCVFDKYDTNKDGKISKEEYKSALKVLGKGAGEAEVTKSFTAIDSDGNGFIDYNEFIEMMHNMGEGINVKDIQSALRVYDLDGNGKISAEELMAVLKKMGERCSLETCRKMIPGADADGDGLITTIMTRTMKVSQR